MSERVARTGWTVAVRHMLNLPSGWRSTMGSSLAERRTGICLGVHLVFVQVHGGQILERAIQRRQRVTSALYT